MSLSDITGPEPTEPTEPTEEEAVAPLIVNDPPIETVQEFIDTNEEENPINVVVEVPEVPTNTISKPLSVLEQILAKAVPITDQHVPRKLMIFSHPGAGKTLLLSQIPNNLIVDTEAGRTVMAQFPELVAEGTVPLPFSSMAGLELVSEEFKKRPPELDKFTTVSIDTMNILKKRGLQVVLDRQYAQNPSFFNKYVPAEGGKEHQEVNAQMQQIVQNFIDSGKDVIISCHAKTFEYKNKQDTIRPDFSEGLGNNLMAMVDVVAYMYLTEIDEVNHRVIKFTPTVGTETQPEIVCKKRIKSLPENIVDPTWTKIQEHWSN